MAAERSSLCGKHVVITGASSGLGAALAVEMASLGAHVTLLARRQKLLDGVATQIRAQGGDALADGDLGFGRLREPHFPLQPAPWMSNT